MEASGRELIREFVRFRRIMRAAFSTIRVNQVVKADRPAQFRRSVRFHDLVHSYRAKRRSHDSAKTDELADQLSSRCLHVGRNSLDRKDSGLATRSGNGLCGK